MIPRYCRTAMASLWSDSYKYDLWLRIELAVCEGRAHAGLMPRDAYERLRQKARFDERRIAIIEKETHHDVIAFLTNVAEYTGDDSAYIHEGLTSSDVVDTAFALQLARAADYLLEDIDALCAHLKTHAITHKHTLCMGRSHGIWAEPTSFGLKMAYTYAEFKRHRQRLCAARDEVSVCALSGPVGSYAHLDPAIEAWVAKKLGLACETLSTQVIPRDRHAMFFATLAVIASSVERLAIEIRHLQRSEVAEAREHFGAQQKGSSAMPHKRNPILSENLTGLARIVRSSVIPACENVALWHERDISHSSVERVIAPDTTTILDFALHRMSHIIKGLHIDTDAMQRHIDQSQGLYASARVLNHLTQSGMARDKAYGIVQKLALTAYDNAIPFKDALAQETAVTSVLSQAQRDALFDPAWYIRHVDTLYARVFPDG